MGEYNDDEYDDRAQAGRGGRVSEPYGGHPEFGPRVVANTANPSIAGWEALAKDALLAFDAARDRPGLDDIVKAARKYHDHRTSIQPYDKTAPPQHYAADGCIKTFDREMKAAALAEAQQREGARQVGNPAQDTAAAQQREGAG